MLTFLLYLILVVSVLLIFFIVINIFYKKESANNWKTIQKEITINQKTLDTYGVYVDFIHLDDERISIRLIVNK